MGDFELRQADENPSGRTRRSRRTRRRRDRRGLPDTGAVSSTPPPPCRRLRSGRGCTRWGGVRTPGRAALQGKSVSHVRGCRSKFRRTTPIRSPPEIQLIGVHRCTGRQPASFAGQPGGQPLAGLQQSPPRRTCSRPARSYSRFCCKRRAAPDSHTASRIRSDRMCRGSAHAFIVHTNSSPRRPPQSTRAAAGIQYRSAPPRVPPSTLGARGEGAGDTARPAAAEEPAQPSLTPSHAPGSRTWPGAVQVPVASLQAPPSGHPAHGIDTPQPVSVPHRIEPPASCKRPASAGRIQALVRPGVADERRAALAAREGYSASVEERPAVRVGGGARRVDRLTSMELRIADRPRRSTHNSSLHRGRSRRRKRLSR